MEVVHHYNCGRRRKEKAFRKRGIELWKFSPRGVTNRFHGKKQNFVKLKKVRWYWELGIN